MAAAKEFPVFWENLTSSRSSGHRGALLLAGVRSARRPDLFGASGGSVPRRMPRQALLACPNRRAHRQQWQRHGEARSWSTDVRHGLAPPLLVEFANTPDQWTGGAAGGIIATVAAMALRLGPGFVE